MERVYVDTSAWIAWANKLDPKHKRVKEAIRQWRSRLVTSNLIVYETITVMRYHFSHQTALRVGEQLLNDPSLQLIRTTVDDEQTAWALFGQRPDQKYSFTDCTSFVLMRRLGLTQAVSLDADFRREGFDLLPG